MELLVQRQGHQSVHPFPLQVPDRIRLRTLEDHCYRIIVHHATLARLKTWSTPLLPPRILRRLTTLTTDDFIELECAPFKDVFGSDMCQRSLSYRVRCLLDGVEYVAAQVGTRDLARFPETSWQWVNIAHPNLVSVYALAVDKTTPNVYLIMDIPEATLKSLETFLVSKGLCFPEHFLWKVAHQLSSVIMHVEDQGLSFVRFDLKNIYLIRNKVMLENGLTSRARDNVVPSFRNKVPVPSLFLGDKINSSGHYELQANSTSSPSVAYLGYVLTKLASIAFVDRRIKKPSEGEGASFLDGFEPLLPAGPATYSSDLFDMLVSLHSTNPPLLSAIHAKATDMMASMRAAMKCMARDENDNEDPVPHGSSLAGRD